MLFRKFSLATDFISVMIKFHGTFFRVGCCTVRPYMTQKSYFKSWHQITQDGTPWHQMQRDSTLYRIAEKIPVHQCCIPLHRRPHSALLKYRPLHGLMQAHRERHTPTRKKRGALLEQYDSLPEHGHRKTGRRNLRTVTPLYPAALQDRQSPVCKCRTRLACESGQPSPILRAGRPGPGGSRTAHLRHPANTRISVEVPNRADIHYTLVQILGAK